ncbi:ATP-dependent Clp protease proteolytic subunit-protein 4, chloroplastic, variant 2 [Ancistrocladus abbreviatus]
MEVASMASHSFLINTRMLATPNKSRATNSTCSINSSCGSSLRAPVSTNFLSPFVASSVLGEFYGLKIRPKSLSAAPDSRPKRGVVTMVIPFSRGSAWEQPPPNLASYLYKNRIVYLGMSLVPLVTELILAEFLYLQYEDEEKPISLYINSTGTTKGDEKLGYETGAFAIYDVMRNIGKSPEQIEADIRRPKYFSPSEAVEYGIIDKVPLIKGCDTLLPVFFRFLDLHFVLTFYGCSTLKEAQKTEELFLS